MQCNVEVTVKNVNQLYNYSTLLGAAIECKPYNEITVEIGTHLRTVKITLNIFALYINIDAMRIHIQYNVRCTRPCSCVNVQLTAKFNFLSSCNSSTP